MSREELIAVLDDLDIALSNNFGRASTFIACTKAVRAVVELHKPYTKNDTPHEIAMGWCKGCSIEYSINEYASQPYPCPTIQAIESELSNG